MLNSQEKLSLPNCVRATERCLSARAHARDTSGFLVTAANFGSGARSAVPIQFEAGYRL